MFLEKLMFYCFTGSDEQIEEKNSPRLKAKQSYCLGFRSADYIEDNGKFNGKNWRNWFIFFRFCPTFLQGINLDYLCEIYIHRLHFVFIILNI